jgi:AcrR family transcriptional regulator
MERTQPRPGGTGREPGPSAAHGPHSGHPPQPLPDCGGHPDPGPDDGPGPDHAPGPGHAPGHGPGHHPDRDGDPEADRPRTRRRGDDLRNAIFAAVLDELSATGYANLTMDSVAAAAGTGKAALYRRWANKDELITDTLRSVLPDVSALPLDGSVRDNALAVLRCLCDAMRLTHGVAFESVKREGATGAAGMLNAMVRQRVLDPGHELMLDVLRRGVASGELRPGAANPRLATTGPAMLIHYAVTESHEVPDDFLVSVVDEVILPATRRAV